MQETGVIKLSKIAYACTAIFCTDFPFVDTIKMLGGYAGEFALQYDVTFVDSKIMKIVKGTMSMGYLPTRTVATYLRYIEFVS